MQHLRTVCDRLPSARHGSPAHQGRLGGMKRTVAVAVSGGVDSMVAAHILKQDDPNVFGLHFVTGFEPAPAGR
ncbi:MAG TPA: hypothetical protein VLT56_04010, partial [Desulfobacterales bacterium]|nr:hypothetical protein [Desulfobacterales bacterium]